MSVSSVKSFITLFLERLTNAALSLRAYSHFLLIFSQKFTISQQICMHNTFLRINRPPFHIQLKKLTNSSHFWQPCMSYTSVPVGQCDKRQVCRLLGSYYYTTTHISSYMHNWEGAPYPLKDFNYAKGSFLKRRHL